MRSHKLLLFGIYAILCIVITSCNAPDYLSETELSQYVLTNEKLSKSIVANGIQIRATYKPTDLLVAQEVKNLENPTATEIEIAQDKYKNHYYFVLSFSYSGKEVLSAATVGMPKFSDLLQTMSFRMTEVVHLTTTNQDTIPVADFVYNRTFGMSNSTDLLFVFDKAKTINQEWIQINIDEFGLGVGKQNIQFKIKELENVPRIYKTINKIQ